MEFNNYESTYQENAKKTYQVKNKFLSVSNYDYIEIFLSTVQNRSMVKEMTSTKIKVLTSIVVDRVCF